MLEVKELEVEYKGMKALWKVDLEVWPSEIVCLLGSNGAGKSTLMNSITGLVKPSGGSITLNGVRLDRLPTHKIVAHGIAHVLERRRIFPRHSVYTNLALGAYLPEARRHRQATLERTLNFLPALAGRLEQRAGDLSGGLQQQLAIGRGLMSRPSIILLDEPFIGLSPVVVDELTETIRRIRDDGVTVLFIEQHVRRALEVSDRGYVLQSGRMVASAPASALLADDRLMSAYFGEAFDSEEARDTSS